MYFEIEFIIYNCLIKLFKFKILYIYSCFRMQNNLLFIHSNKMSKSTISNNNKYFKFQKLLMK